MTRKYICILFLLLCCGRAEAQFTLVSGTVTDANGLPYSCGTLSASIINLNGQNLYLSGAPFSPQPAATKLGCPTDATTSKTAGAFSVQLADNTQIKCGSGASIITCATQTQWLFTINNTGAPPPIGTGPQVCTTPLTISGASQTVSIPNCPGLSQASGAAIPGTPGLTALPVQSGLMAEYRMLPGETCGGLLDYSGNGRNATGTVGTAPTIISGSGGCSGGGSGAVSLPASLNSAVTIELVVTYHAQNNFAVTNPEPIGGNSTAANSISYPFVQNNGLSGQFIFSTVQDACNSAFQYIDREFFEQTNLVSWVLGAAGDTVYVGQIALNPGGNGGGAGAGCLGAQTAGNYQLFGANISVLSFCNCNIYYAAFYNRALSATEISLNYQYLVQTMAKRAVTLTATALPSTTNNLLTIYGDSISLGTGVVTPWPFDLVTSVLGNFSTLGNVYNMSIGFKDAAGAATSPLTDTTFTPASPRQMWIEWAGTNDMCSNALTAAATEAANAANLILRRKEGYKTGVATMISRTGCDASKNSFDALLRSNWTQYADFLIDVASDPNLGADGANANTTFFNVDAVHPTQNSVHNIIAPMMNRAISKAYGAKDFSSGSVYASAAAAATATTAGSETGTVITLTFAANPFPLGAYIVCTGITPGGYNSPAGLGWYVLVSNATQVQYITATTGLGAITVQGTCSTPQQADGDQYYTLNFGAGNHTLNTCRGFTGQNIYIRNINAAGSTLVPFGSETITGPGTTTVAANTTAILQSQLVSSSASGCNWVRLQ